MRQFVLASHGYFAEGIYDSLCMIMGKQHNFTTLCAYVDPNLDLKNQVKEVMSQFDNDDEVIVVTDIFGGSINNEFMNVMNTHPIYLIAGLNLPLLIELVTSQKQEEDTEKWLQQTISITINTIQYCSKKTLVTEPIENDF